MRLFVLISSISHLLDASSSSRPPRDRIFTHYHQTEYDPRPRVFLKFVTNARNKILSLLFDTGSSFNYVLSFGRLRGLFDGSPAYVTSGLAPQTDGPRKLLFGTAGYGWSLDTTCQIEDSIIVFSSGKELYPLLSFKARFDLIPRMANPQNGSGTLGAAKTSDFARKVGIFAIIPSMKSYDPRNPVFAGQIILGQDRIPAIARRECHRGKLVEIPALGGPEATHWMIPGSSRVVSGSFRAQHVTWIIDTGAPGIHLPPLTYDDLVSEINRSGASAAAANVIHNCPKDYLSRFPNLIFTLGSVDIILTPSDYIMTYYEETKLCLLFVYKSHREGDSSSGLIGTGVLSKTLVVFDQRNDKLAVCPTSHRKL